MALVACFGLSSVCWAAAGVGEQWGAGGDFVLRGSDGHGAMGLESGRARASYRTQWSSISRNDREGSPRQSWGDSHGWEPWADVLWIVC